MLIFDFELVAWMMVDCGFSKPAALAMIQNEFQLNVFLKQTFLILSIVLL